MTIKNRYAPLAAGTILVAEPFADDRPFNRSVVLVCDHDETEGTVGFMLNKSLGMTVDRLMKGMTDFPATVYYGGPVQTDTLHYLHTKGDLINGSIPVLDGLYWGGDYEQMRFCVQHELIKMDEIRFYIGYSGWSGGQLRDELELGTWILAPGSPNYIFQTPAEQLWRTVLEHKGEAFSVIGQMDIQIMN